ncbi:hypothetical protein K435DRAFT_808771 [Dendrothele bispora CBS 962.96]|uniref:Uncharacterized protein n=1 Tax=Dendrothele bispora (strain CBS 962.96) TaxID=1314807 RepID=A0A4V6T509_DENBC|nr:hypothetical protein K435DRAFT_808771 [Dendrothele bispora CBS 962.96]
MSSTSVLLELDTVKDVVEALSNFYVPTSSPHHSDVDIAEVSAADEVSMTQVGTDATKWYSNSYSNWGMSTWSWLQSSWGDSQWGDERWGVDGVKELFAKGDPFTKDAAQSRVNLFQSRSSAIVQQLRQDNASGLQWLEMWGRTGSRVVNGVYDLPWHDTPDRNTRLDNLPPEQWAKIQFSLVQYDRYEERDGTQAIIEREPSFSGPMVAKLLFAAHVQWDERHRKLTEIRMGMARLKEILQSLQQDEIAAMTRLGDLECHIYRLQRLEQSLPFDILLPIGENADRPTCRNLSLTSRQVCSVVRPYVFRDLHVSTTQNLPKLIAFMSRSSNEKIAACVRSLTFHCNNGHWPPDSDRATDLLDQVVQLVGAIPVRSLCFEGLGGAMEEMVFSWNGQGLLSAVGVSTELACLELCDCTLEPDDLADILSFEGRTLSAVKLARPTESQKMVGWTPGKKARNPVLVAGLFVAGRPWDVRELRYTPKVSVTEPVTVEGLERLFDTSLAQTLEQFWVYAPFHNEALEWVTDVANVLSSWIIRMPNLNTVGLAMIISPDVALRFSWNPRTHRFIFQEARIHDRLCYRYTEQKLSTVSFFAFLKNLATAPYHGWDQVKDGWELYNCFVGLEDRYSASWCVGTFGQGDASACWVTDLWDHARYSRRSF